MDDTMRFEPASDDPAEYRRAIRAMLDEMKRIDERIARHQANIDRLKVETRQILDELKAA
jgi:hypothetical protein